MAKKVVRRNLVDQVGDILQESILEGEYKEGEKLPSENELAEEFGTSRLTVRLAIQKLNTMGLLETRVGEGSYVKKFNYEQYIGNVSHIIFRPNMMKDIKDYRSTLETGFTVLAAQKRTDQELLELNQLCMDYENLYQSSEDDTEDVWDEMARWDYEIHLKICRMSHNALYLLTYQTMRDILINYMKEIIKTRKTRYEKEQKEDKFLASLKTHRRVFEAIKEQDTEKCRDVIRNMVDYENLMPEHYL